MKKTGVVLGSAAMALSLFLSYPAFAQDVEFGDDSSRWANDGQCDDPRFEGEGAATVRISADEGHDATDCQAAFEAGTITLVGASSPDAPEAPTQAQEVLFNFGDDSGNWANDGECDDPRFGGSLESHLMADATDCRAAFEADPSIYVESVVDATVEGAQDAIDYGDDSGSWANDGECDDPRFGGSLESHVMADATDCRAAYEAGEVAFNVNYGTANDGDIDFGDDSGSWANDGECDDPRFGGALTSHEFADATDCRAAYEADPSIYVATTDSPESPEGPDGSETGEIDFGDDSGNWANDGECDDPRFGGSLESHLLADATDCRAAYEADPSIYVGDGSGTDYPIIIDGIDFGNDDGDYAMDGECDDPRFVGDGVGAALDSHLMADATDCSSAYQAGIVTLAEDSSSAMETTGFRINFGDDTGSHPNDGECDDPRFQGRGAAMELYDDNILGDATDCRAAYEAGTVTYVP